MKKRKTLATGVHRPEGVAINQQEVDDMPHSIRTIFEWVLRLLLPARGCHRAAAVPPVSTAMETSPLLSPDAKPRAVLLRGEDSYLIRPYVLTSEERRERRAQRGRRKALWLAVHGYDAGPRWIHGVEVGA
ncbi:hypothetical protein [Streptomyces sp. NPDC101150]|uniref:hypothetical protein n=1 Tax=Streptomyces sp. NPDC101150 TaxID=3366114 RepID=UPI0037F3EA37